MGGVLGQTQTWISRDQLDFYMNVKDVNVGNVSILTSHKNLPMCYIMKMKIIGPQAPELAQNFQQISKRENNNMVKMYDCVESDDCMCNSNGIPVSLQTYWEYFNFSLGDMIVRRQAKATYFSQQELWYVVRVCCQTALVLKHSNLYMQFDPQKVVVTPDGKLKVFWAHVKPRNMHLGLHKYLFLQKLEQHYYSPQEIDCINNWERDVRMNLEGCSIFSLGVLLLYCITLLNPLEHLYSFNEDIKINMASIRQIILTFKAKRLYSGRMWKLVEQCLKQNSGDRLGFSEVVSMFEQEMQDEIGLSLVSTTCGSVSNSTVNAMQPTANRISLRRETSRVSTINSF